MAIILHALAGWRRAGCIFLLGCLLAAGAARGAVPATSAMLSAHETYEQAHRLANLYFFDKARQATEDGLRRFPDDWPLNQLYVHIHNSMDRLPELMPYYQAKIAREPKNAIGYAGAAVVNLMGGSTGAAEEFVRKAGDLAPGSLEALMVNAWLERGRSGSQPNGREKTMAAYQKLITAYPDFWPGMGQYLYFLRNDEEHKAELRRVLRIAEEHKANPFYLVYPLGEQQKREEPWFDPRTAIPVYERILKLEPTLVSIRDCLAATCGNLGDAERQRRELEEITHEAPEWLEGWKNLADFHAAHQEYDAALDCLERARQTPYDAIDKPGLELDRTRILTDAGRFEEAERELREFIKSHAEAHQADEARQLLTTLVSRKPTDRIRRLKNVPYLQQKGAYCGPASLSMVLGYWGVKKSQDEIAATVYTGVAGTASQTIEAYCKSLGFEARAFQGDPKTWKRLLDQGLPVLWLKWSGNTSSHYTVVVGYNELEKSFILHNPWYAHEITAEAETLDDTWSLPSQRLSLVIYPAGRAGEFKLGELAAPWSFRATNELLYLVTGSNLFRRFFPNVLVNVAALGAVLLLVVGLMRAGCGPRDRAAAKWYLAVNLAVILLLCFVIHQFRSPLGVELLVVYHLSLVAFVGVMILFVVRSQTRGKDVTCVQAMRLHVMLFALGATIGWTNHRAGWYDLIVALVALVEVFYCVYENWILLVRVNLNQRFNNERAIATCRKFGSGRKPGRGLITAWLCEAELEKRRCNYPRATELMRGLLATAGVGRLLRRRAERVLIEALMGFAADTQDNGTALEEAHERLAAWRGRRCGRLETFCRDVLSARAALLAGETEAAVRHCAAAEAGLQSGRLARALERGLAFLRGYGRDYRQTMMLHALNRLALARRAGDEPERKKINQEFAGLLDEEFMKKKEFYTLGRDCAKDREEELQISE